MSINLRVAELTDIERCTELLQMLSGRKSIDEGVFELFVIGERGLVIVAEEDNLIHGFASLSFNLGLRFSNQYCQLEELIVDPAARGKNIGALLMNEAVRVAREKDCQDFGLYLIESTEHNRPFYEKFGFVRVGSEMRQELG
jgi:GNAT superfamily N-acetyltransferase